jgi:hypothetical protein
LLKNIDLSPTQIKIYLSVLKNGLSTVLDICKDTKINRSQIYYDTSILVERGILELAAKRKRKFLAVQPNKIGKIVKEKAEKLKELEIFLPEVDSYFGTKVNDKEENKVTIFEGISQVQRAYEIEFDETAHAEIYSLIGAVSYQESMLPVNFWKKWNTRFAHRGGKGRMIVSKNDESYFARRENNHHCTLKTRGLERFDLKTNIDIWGDKVLTVTYSKRPSAVLVQNQVLADSYKDLFEKLWIMAD